MIFREPDNWRWRRAQVDGGRVGLIVDARLGPEGAGARDRWEAELAANLQADAAYR